MKTSCFKAGQIYVNSRAPVNKKFHRLWDNTRAMTARGSPASGTRQSPQSPTVGRLIADEVEAAVEGFVEHRNALDHSKTLARHAD